MTAGALADGRQALYVTGVTDNSVASCDIMTLKNGVLRNIVHNMASPAAGGVFRFLSLYPADMNGSGVIEVPEPLPLPALDEESETYYRIRWRDYDSTGESDVVCCTFHNMADGWYFILPESWDGRVTLRRSSVPGENSVLFFALLGDTPQPFLEICALSGDGRESRARRGDRFVLARQVETIYTAELLPCDDWAGRMSEEDVKAAFSLIVAEWTTGEN